MPTTLLREIPGTPLINTGSAQHDASRVAPDPATIVAPSRRLLLGLGVAAAVIAIAWAIAAIDLSPAPPTPAELPKAVPPIEVVTPAPAKKTEVAAGPASAPPVSKTVSKEPQRLRSARCLAIEEKFQQTGQITATDRDFLRSRECQT